MRKGLPALPELPTWTTGMQGLVVARLVPLCYRIRRIAHRRRRPRQPRLIEPCGQYADGVFGARRGDSGDLPLSVLLHIDDGG